MHAAANEHTEDGCNVRVASKEAVPQMTERISQQEKKGGDIAKIANHTLSQFAG